MMSNTSGRSPLSVLFFGMRCAFSGPPFAALLAAGHDVRAIVLPGAPFGPTVVHQSPATVVPIAGQGNDDLDDVARRAGIPMISIRDPGHPDAIEAIAGLRPAMIAVACFPWRLPRAILDLPLHGCLNVHPSLLPVGRGPEPIFWTFRRGDRETGTTIHLMDERFDAGPILRQERVVVPNGVRAPVLERQLAEVGGRLLVDAIDLVVADTARGIPQDETRSTAARYPTVDDYLVPTDRPAHWAFNFVRGIAPLGGPLYLHVVETGEQFPILDALDFTEHGDIDVPTLVNDDLLTVQFHPGTARFILGA